MEELQEAANMYYDAAKIISQALEECSHPTLTKKDHDGNARAIIARLAHANILLGRYTPEDPTTRPASAESIV